MKLIRYLFRKMLLPCYILIAGAISAIFMLAANGGWSELLRMLPVVLLLLLMMRAADDYFDYEKDSERRTQHLSKRALILLFSICAAVFVTINILFYGAFGTISLAAVLYILLMDKLPLLKLFFMALLFLYYFFMNCAVVGVLQYSVSAACLIISTVYCLVKRKVRR